MTDMMRVIEIVTPGNASVLSEARRPIPSPGSNEVLIKVKTAGINRPDIFQRKGLYPPPPGASDIPGLEVAGEIVALGHSVSEWHHGDQVCALLTGGGYAEYVNVPALQCLPVPKGLSMKEAAALPETCFTVWANLFEAGALKVGAVLLVHGGASGIGTMAIQFAHALGIRVFATAGSDEKCHACRRLGAEYVVNYKMEDFVNIFKFRTDGRGVDVILDMVGGEYMQRNIDLAAVDGHIIMIGFLGGSKATVNFMPLMLKRLILTGSTLRTRTVAFKADVAAALRQHIWPLIEVGRIRPQIFASFPLAEAAEAHRLMESNLHIGKIMLDVST